ncbi:MAG: glycerol-3-phosphate dehydrogenase, partial [Pseudomonadota bacterium]|nr:glycerol-3-phosphate dehydrogenase [Pseudomonadota bacterium]
LTTAQGLGAEVAPGLFETELAYLHRHEWARCADDVLWRRTKLGLHYSEAQRAAVAQWCTTRWGAPGDAAIPHPEHAETPCN